MLFAISLRQEFDARRKIILSRSHLFINREVINANWRGRIIRLWLRCFLNDSSVVLVPNKKRFLPPHLRILSELWQTLYLLGPNRRVSAN